MSVPKPNPFLAPSESNVCRTRVITTDLGGGYAADKALVACSARSEVLRGHHNNLQTFRPYGASGSSAVSSGDESVPGSGAASVSGC